MITKRAARRMAVSVVCRVWALILVDSPTHADKISSPDVTTLAITDPVFDFIALTATQLDARVLKTTEKDGIVSEEVMYHSEIDGTNSVDIFGLFSYPKGGEKLPAFVWNQGGLAQAGTYWTEFGARRGYATLCIDFPMPGYRSTGGYPIVSGLELGDDPKKAPIYHGAVALLKAVSFLQSRKEVNPERIGMAGSSWGGFYTTLMAGIDPRLKACTAMFGTGSLQLGNSWWDSWGKSGRHNPASRERWRTTLDPALRLKHSKVPIGWFTGTNDGFYWMPAVMATFAAANGPKHLTLVPNWDHGLPPIQDEQVFAWLDVHLKAATPFNEVKPLRVEKRSNLWFATWEFSGPRAVKSGDLMVSYGEDGNWSSRYWLKLDATIEGKKCEAQFSPAAMPCYVSGTVTDEQGFRYSTPLLRVDASSSDAHVPDHDGCSEWGSFEPQQVAFLKALAFMNPTTSTDAKEGKQSCVLKGKTDVGRIYFTAGLPHSFTCYVKADKYVEMKVGLSGVFDGQSKIEEQTVRVGTAWTQLRMDYLPPKALSASLVAVFTLPEGASALLDCVEFHASRGK